MKFLAIIPARGLSKGIPRKNVRLVAGKPLIAWTIEAALNAKGVDRVLVSTEDEEIAEVARQYGAEVPFLRPLELSQDETPTLPVLQNVVFELKNMENFVPDAVITLQPTSPLRTCEHIDDAIERFKADPLADSLVSCIEVPHIFHPLSVMKQSKHGYLENYLDNKEGVRVYRRQDKERVWARNGAAIYITRLNCLDRFIFGGNILPFIMDNSASIDIDCENDLQEVEIIFRKRQGPL
jgi:CMP-N,N'-diacetyllegionaminic acid synthase